MMNPRRLALTVALAFPVLVAGCRGPESDTFPVHSVQATPFDHLLAYVPAGMESVLMLDLDAKAWPKEISDLYSGKIRRGVFAGRRFRFPKGLGMGDFDGVFVLEGPRDTESLIPEGESVHVFSYGVADVRRVKGDHTLFFARVAPTQMLYATNESMMRAALRREGVRGRILAGQMGWQTELPWASVLVLLRKPNPTIDESESGPNRRTPIWVVSGNVDAGSKRRSQRVASLVAYVTDARRLEFEARVKTVGEHSKRPVPMSINLYEPGGVLDFLGSPASTNEEVLILSGNLRHIEREGAFVIGPLLVAGMLGVRIMI